jgi:hypothetical protein
MAEAKKAAKDTVYLDVDDDITTLIDKVEGAKNKVVALVLPKRFATLQSIVNMRLLQRSAKTADKNVVLITSEQALLPLAGAAGLHVAKNLQSKPEIPPSPVDSPPDKPELPEDPDAEIDADTAKLDYHRSVGELAAVAILDDAESIPLDDADEAEKAAEKKPKAKKDKKLQVPDFDKFRLRMALIALAGILLLVFLFLAMTVWPKATITMKTEATPLGVDFSLTTSDKVPALDEAKHIIPAALKTSDLNNSQQVQATGQQNNGQKAAGSVTVSNCSNSPVSIPAGTGITQGGLAYITQKSLSLDSGNFTSGGVCKSSGSHVGSTDIVAQIAGSKYNVSGATFSVRSEVSGTGSASGGTDNIQTILSQSDVDAAKNKISDQDKNSFNDNFKKQLSDQGYYVIEPTLKAGDPAVNASPAVGQPAGTATVSIKITYSALVVKKDDLKKVVTDELNKQIDQKKQKIGTDDVLKNLSVDVQSLSSPTVAVLSLSEDTTAVPIIDVAAVKKQVAGQKVGDIKSILNGYPGVNDVSVKLSPFWVSKAPKKPGKIIIIQQQVKEQP